MGLKQAPYIGKDLCSYVDYFAERNEHFHWKDNKPFGDTLVFDGFERGRSAAHAIFLSKSTGAKFQMFLANLGEVIRSGVLGGGIVFGTWHVVKKGCNYGIAIANDEEEAK